MKILLIKLGALGDMVQTLPFFKAFKQQHPHDEVILLTSRIYKNFMEETGYFDGIWTVERKGLCSFLKAVKRVRAYDFSKIYDLQLVDRTSYWGPFFTVATMAKWYGYSPLDVFLEKHRHIHKMHGWDRLQDLFKKWGLEKVSLEALNPFEEKIFVHEMLKNPYALFAIGASLTFEGGKIWPLEHYQKVINSVYDKGILPVVIGGKLEQTKKLENCLNLIEKTSIQDLFPLSKNALFCLSNDTGAGHIFASSKTPTLILYGRHTDPVQCAPRLETVITLRKEQISAITPLEVLEALGKMVGPLKD
ncbi:MAG TPA: glycosyltransferase family 9 protein [Alphaproteobacteria bacterium]|nr:glycosyltransferase family 9 protein [Alphaproteobacteria bacterium]